LIVALYCTTQVTNFEMAEMEFGLNVVHHFSPEQNEIHTVHFSLEQYELLSRIAYFLCTMCTFSKENMTRNYVILFPMMRLPKVPCLWLVKLATVHNLSITTCSQLHLIFLCLSYIHAQLQYPVYRLKLMCQILHTCCDMRSLCPWSLRLWKLKIIKMGKGTAVYAADRKFIRFCKRIFFIYLFNIAFYKLLRFWRMVSSGMLHHVALVRTDVS
jgi:hypothetical protein